MGGHQKSQISHLENSKLHCFIIALNDGCGVTQGFAWLRIRENRSLVMFGAFCCGIQRFVKSFSDCEKTSSKNCLAATGLELEQELKQRLKLMLELERELSLELEIEIELELAPELKMKLDLKLELDPELY